MMKKIVEKIPRIHLGHDGQLEDSGSQLLHVDATFILQQHQSSGLVVDIVILVLELLLCFLHLRRDKFTKQTEATAQTNELDRLGDLTFHKDGFSDSILR